MIPPPPSLVSVRAINQYRRRDVFTYLALRYYLSTSSARRDSWCSDVAPAVVLGRTAPGYFRAAHFKEIVGDERRVEHRHIYLPGANEALAESWLLRECSLHAYFANPPCVFSYELAHHEAKNGMFCNYMDGLRKRHGAVALACLEFPAGIVQYTDIRRFYPSIPHAVAREAWRKAVGSTGLERRAANLGEKLLDDYAATGDSEGASVIVGPMFSHLIANLVLRDIDRLLSSRPGVRYFRYVDDMIFVGNPEVVREALGEASDALAMLGLEMHDRESSKSLVVACSTWLVGSADYQEQHRGISWMTLIGDLKRFLLLHPERREELASAAIRKGLRLPVVNYGDAVRERSFLARFRDLISFDWLRTKAKKISVDSILQQADHLRGSYGTELQQLMVRIDELDAYELKRRLPKIRYRAGRLVYIGQENALLELGESMETIPALAFHAAVMKAVATGNVTNLLAFGGNATQAAAQPLRAAQRSAVIDRLPSSSVEWQGLSVFGIYGVPVVGAHDMSTADEICRLAFFAGSDRSLMSSQNSFIREAACLHGIGLVRHSEMMGSAFDKDEELAMDAVDQFHLSVS